MFGDIKLQKKEDGFTTYPLFLSRTTMIKNTKVTTLTKRLNEINKMTKEQLREHYISVMGDGEMSAKGGGGLGLIDIVRKTGEKLLFDFVSIDSEYSFFELNVKITK